MFMKKKYFIYCFTFALFQLVVMMSSCGKDSSGENFEYNIVEIEEITLEQTVLNMVVGDAQSLTAYYLPENANIKTIQWSSSDISVATVDQNGVVTAVSGGNAVITAASKGNKVTATCLVNVKTYVDDEVEFNGGKNDGVQLNVSALKLPNGTMEVLDAQLTSEYSGKRVLWKSSNTDVVEVSDSGIITCVTDGSAYVVAQIENTDKTDTCHISVVDIDGETLWYGDPTKDFYYSFYNISKEGDDEYTKKEGTIKPIDGSEYGTIWEVHKPADNKRCEFARTEGDNNYYEIKDGDRVYVGWRVKMDIKGQEMPDSYLQFQLKTEDNGWQNHPVSIEFEPKISSLIVAGIYPVDTPDASVSNRTTKFCTVDMKENEWTEIVLGFNFSTNPEISFVEVWINGVRQLLTDGKGARVFKAYHRTIDMKADNSGPAHMYFKWGIYNAASAPYDIYGYFDEMRVGKTLKDVMNPLLISRN